MASYSSNTSGGWSNASIWNTVPPTGTPPGIGDTATINNGHVVEIDGDTTVGTTPNDQTTYVVTVMSGGILKWADAPSGNWTFEVRGNIDIRRGGTFTIGSETARIPSAYTATLSFPVNLSTTTYWRIYNKGTFKAYGAESYHMASNSMQRAKLTAGVTPTGGAVTFVVDASVDWQTGDICYFGIGGDKTAAMPTDDTAERLSITRINATTFQATFVNAHKANDFVVQGMRNVIIVGGSNTNKGFQIYSTSESTTVGLTDYVSQLDWVTLRYGGESSTYEYATLAFIAQAGDKTFDMPAANLLWTNLVFDQSSGSRNASYDLAFCMSIYTGTYFSDQTKKYIQNVHLWDCGQGICLYVLGGFGIDKVSSLYMSYIFLKSVDGRPALSNVWFESRRHDQLSWNCIEGSVPSMTNIEVHHAHVFYTPGGDNYREIHYCENLKIYHSLISLNIASSYYIIDAIFIDCEFCWSYQYIVFLDMSSRLTFVNCSFDYANTLGTATGAIYSHQQSYPHGFARFIQCTFGKTGRNNYGNIRYTYASNSSAVGRVILDECEFVQPTNCIDAGPNGYVTAAMFFACSGISENDWRQREFKHINFSTEFRRCKVWNSTQTVDKWLTDYPNVTQLAHVCGGGEIRNEITTVIDSTYARKLLPFSTMYNMVANYVRPIQIPVTSGQVVTCKLSFNKNADGAQGLPGLWLFGCGVDEKMYTTAGVFGSWEEVTIIGTAAQDGICNLYVLGGTNINSATSSSGGNIPAYGPPTSINGSDTMFGVVVYADQLSIEVV